MGLIFASNARLMKLFAANSSLLLCEEIYYVNRGSGE
jgi:hypothetical protein